MVKFYISYQHMGADVAHLCERQNPDGTIDWIFISQFDNNTKIRTGRFSKRSILRSDSNFKVTSGAEFIEAYIDVTKNFQLLSYSLFSDINSKTPST